MCEYNIGAKLVELRAAKGATQEDVASALSVSNKTVSKWENGASAPDLGMLVALARYYNVSADHLLGIEAKNDTLEERVAKEFEDLTRHDAALKCFELAQAVFPACFDAVDRVEDEPIEVIPPPADDHPRSAILLPELFNFSVRSSAVNLAVIQLRNRENFAWLTAPEKQNAICRLLRLLSDPDALSVCSFLHNAARMEHFTAARVSETTGVSPEKAEAILDGACHIPGLCHKTIAHLAEGDLVVYDSEGSGLVLAILSLAYETTCGWNAYRWNYNSNSRMITGGEQA